MSHPIFFSCEAESPAGAAIMRVLHPLEEALTIDSLAPFCPALDTLFIIPSCVSRDFMARHAATSPVKARRFISWQNRYADIRLLMDWEAFTAADPATQAAMCHQVIRHSLDVIAQRCARKNIPFHKEALLQEILPDA